LSSHKPNNNSSRNTLIALANLDATYKADRGSLVKENELYCASDCVIDIVLNQTLAIEIAN
tara:strand:- start:514 stop:696 length:183 start_codon:yes stop_codon:yes gene_type:complete